MAGRFDAAASQYITLARKLPVSALTSHTKHTCFRAVRKNGQAAAMRRQRIRIRTDCSFISQTSSDHRSNIPDGPNA